MFIDIYVNEKNSINNCYYAKNFIDRLLGLHKLNNFNGILFLTRFGIHTLFLKQPIDVVILNNDNKVVTIKKRLSPNRFFFWNPKFKTVLEFSSGFIEKYEITPNSQINFEPKIKT